MPVSGSASSQVGITNLSSNTIADNNTAIGASALSANTTGDFNTAIGAEALEHFETGSNNTSTGSNALFGCTVLAASEIQPLVQMPSRPVPPIATTQLFGFSAILVLNG